LGTNGELVFFYLGKPSRDFGAELLLEHFSSTACWIFDCSYSLRNRRGRGFLVEDVAAHLRFDALELGFSGLELIFGVQRIALELGLLSSRMMESALTVAPG